MRLSLFSALLALTAVGPSNGKSNLTFFGAPRASLDGVLSVLTIEEDYILWQTDSVSNTAFGAAGPLQCSASNPCADGSCCNSQGQCGFRDEHCKNNCVANCDATAPCGVNSKGGSRTCPLNVCCSYFGFCGASEAFCRDTTASGESTPCQKQFGKCGTVTAQSTPTCGKGSGTASRKVAYYQGWNTRRRPCDKVWPANIDTAGLTHLIFSFATIDPTTFAVSPMHPDDEKLYADFLALKDGSRKWIGVGGWEFSDVGATRYTWSQMVRAKANRGAFIASLLEFLDKWKFQGVDIDWEWPGAESRGGNPAIDKQNQVDLMKELREALGSRGLSVVLPAQYEYLKNIDPKALEAQVDSFNVLAYNLHGPWDATIPGLGARVKPHTDLKEIDTALDLFWFNDVNPSKINLGIANYGRGYALEDASCARYDCPWTSPSDAGECTELAGVLSQCEIQRIIRQKNLKPEIIDGGVKQIVFDGQWVGYDDDETLGLKTELANNRCLGGTALWAIDYASCSGGGPGNPGAPQSSSAASSASAPGVSVAPSTAVTVAPSIAVSSVPPSSSAPAASSVPAASSTSSSAPSSAAWSTGPPPTSSTAFSVVPSSQTSQAWSSTITPTSSMPQGSSGASSATSSEPASTGAPLVIVVSSSGSSQTQQSSPSSSETIVTASEVSSTALSSSVATSQEASTSSSSSSSGSSAWASSAASSTVPVSFSPSSASQSSSQATLEATSSLGSSAVWTSISSDAASTASPAPSNTSGTSSSWASASTTATGTTSAWASNSADASSSIRTSSEQSSAATSSIVQSSQTSSGTTPSVASWTKSPPQSGATNSEFSRSVPQSSATISASASSSPASSVTATSGSSSAASWSATSSIGGFSWASSASGQTSAWSASMISSTAQTSPSYQWSSTAASSAAVSSGSQEGSKTITSSPDSTSVASRIQDQERTTTDDHGNTIIVIITQPNDEDDKPDPTKTKDPEDTKTKDHEDDKTRNNDHEDDKTKDPGGDKTKDPDSNPTSKPGSTTNSDPANTGSATATTHPGGETTPAITGTTSPLGTPTEAPPDGALMKGCMPNDCVAECAPWYAISLVLFKRPFCPCKVVTCKPDDDEDDWSDIDSDGEDDDCSLFGCGCGWMGLPFGPGCDINFELPNIFPLGLFGPNPCLFFGGCPPGVGPPNPDLCGPFGCNGYCNLPPGCDPCPPEICGGPLKCPKPEGCGPTPGPNPTPNPTRPTKCEKEQETTVTEKLVYCTENIKLEPTTIASLNFTLTSTLTSMCLTPILYTRTGCGVLDTTMTTTISSFTITSSSSSPMCSRAPLDLNNDEGDNEQPTSSEGPSCTRAPLSLDDDEGDNEQPTSFEAPACIHAPLSLDDDEGNNEMPANMSSSSSLSFCATASTTSSVFLSMPTPSSNSSSIVSLTSMVMTSSSSSVSRVPPPSTLSISTTPPWGTDIPSGTPAPANCPTCNEYFDKCVNYRCNADGSNAEKCAKECLAALCYSGDSIDYCKKSPCRPAACPKENPTTFENVQPGAPFTTVLSLSGTKITVSPTPSYSMVSLPHSPTPTCNPGHTISPIGNWTVLVEHEIKEKPDNATLTWQLWDEHGCEAGSGSGWNNILGANLTQEIGAWDRDPGWNMGYALHTNVTESTSASQSEIEFEISKFPAGCMEMCWTKWKINTRDESRSWQITDNCARQCGMQKLGPTDVGCGNGINKWHDNGDSSIQKRGGYCWFRMPFEPGDDSASPPPKPWTRDSRWTLEVVQQMEYEDASIEWWLEDPNGNRAGHFWFGLNAEDVDVVGSTVIETQDRDAYPELKMRYKMLLTVAYPRNKDNTTITLTYQNGKIDGCKYSSDSPSKVLGLLPLCQPSYQTESNDETKQSHLNDCSSDPDHKIEICPTPMLADKIEFSCDKVLDAFYPKGAGFERKFKCWWPHDFVAPYGNMDDVGTMGFGGMNGTLGALGIDGGVNSSWTNAT